MRDQIAKYAARLAADRSADPGAWGFAAQDDAMIADGDPAYARLAAEALAPLSCLALLAARPSLPFADLLVRRAPPGDDRIVPRDTETRTFLHDIPIVRREALREGAAGRIASLLRDRKGVVAEGVGIVATGAVTVEQAYIHYSSVFHALFVKYLHDLLREGFLLPGEAEAFAAFRREWLQPLSAEGLSFREGPMDDTAQILDEIAAAGRHTVERGLVDSFFGNISYRSGGVVYISQTAASLDELSGRIDPVPDDDSSTAGITASSELLAHRRIYAAAGARAILHGHPKFTVVMSMVCEETGCDVADCWRDCPRVRLMGDTPVVAGEIGAGGLAKRVPPVIGATGRAAVYGHGVFTTGRSGFGEAFRAMLAVENYCREEYFRRHDAMTGGPPRGGTGDKGTGSAGAGR